MLVAKCSVCKTKTELQRCEVCEEAKCVNCAQQHLTAVKTKWTTIETRFNEIKLKTKIKQTLLLPVQQKTDEQLTYLKQQHNIILEKLKREYEEYQKQLATSKSQCNNQLAELENRWNELQTNEVFRKWITTTDESRYLLTENSSEMEKLITSIESYVEESNNNDIIECHFSPSTNVSLGKLLRVRRTHQNDTITGSAFTMFAANSLKKK